MNTISINRAWHIMEILNITVAAFKARGIEINHDQAHCLWDLVHWSGAPYDIYEEVNNDVLVDFLLKNAEVIAP